jgi:hypothetical protein
MYLPLRNGVLVVGIIALVVLAVFVVVWAFGGLG